MPTPIIRYEILAASANAAVSRMVRPAPTQPLMLPVQIAAMIEGARHYSFAELGGRLDDAIDLAKLETRARMGEFNRLVALKQARVAVNSDGFEDRWNQWRRA